MKIFNSFTLFFFCTLAIEIHCQEISPPGEWRHEAHETTYISCHNLKVDEENSFCQLSKGGAFYRVYCSKMETTEVRLKVLNQSFYCHAEIQKCLEPIACAILEKVVYLPGADHCQHGEVKTQRKCPDLTAYRFDNKMILGGNKKIVDQCCRDVEFFARPGISL